MAQRLRLYDLRHSRLPGLVGNCKGDVQVVADVVNTAQQRLLYAKEAGDESWYGTWAEMVFQVDPAIPYITCPRDVARIEMMTVCDCPVPVQNQFYEYLQFGNGTLPRICGWSKRGLLQAHSKNNAVTFVDLSSPPKLMRAYATNSADVGRSVLFQGLDNNNMPIYSLGVTGNVTGVFVKLEAPFVTTPMPFNSLTGIQKDVTIGPVQIMQVDQTTGDETLLLTMDPGETTAWYRRYYLNRLPRNCCQSTTGRVQVKAIVKLDLIPVVVDTDYCLIQNKEALICEAQSARLSEVDSADAKTQAQEQHMQAIRLLNGELAHWIGRDNPAVEFAPFGSAKLSRVNISMI